ncbi:hypothetical protein QTI66_35040 [Variovorax sp. J22R133]|uniref:hypothetical protein n=1 Tax=Variovorax brevis TaxID=3053503 RepID=UPI002575D850|nr:hypothetical protein [Variovorax sp. J22R133]MDM0117335.1 hypothetical protein [Variovorax sp. J22R133]
MRTTTSWLLGGFIVLAGLLPAAQARDHCGGSGRCGVPGNGLSPDELPTPPSDAQWADPDGPSPHVASIDSMPGGQSYGRWAVQWWQWLLSVPKASNPLSDVTGENCAMNQVDKVWFLAGAGSPDSVVRSCTIPAGRSLFFPLINVVWAPFPEDPPEEKTERFVRSHARCTNVRIEEATIDGQKVPHPGRFFTGASGSRSALFNALLPAGNLFDLDAGALLTPAAEQGYYLFVRPLSPGVHTIHWIASGCSEGGLQDITYHLKVVRPERR